MPQCIPQHIKPIPNHSNLNPSEQANPSRIIAEGEAISNNQKKEESKVNGRIKRNVYKSIIRSIHTYTRKNSLSLMKMLQDKGFSKEEIEHAFFVIGSRQEEKKHKFKFLTLLKRMVRDKSIYTYILKETLNAMISEWEKGKRGRILEKNYKMYKEVCEAYYRDALKTLSNN